MKLKVIKISTDIIDGLSVDKQEALSSALREMYPSATVEYGLFDPPIELIGIEKESRNYDKIVYAVLLEVGGIAKSDVERYCSELTAKEQFGVYHVLRLGGNLDSLPYYHKIAPVEDQRDEIMEFLYPYVGNLV